MIQQWLGFRAPSFPGCEYIPAVFGTGVYLYGAGSSREASASCAIGWPA